MRAIVSCLLLCPSAAFALDDAPEVEYPVLPVHVADLADVVPAMWTLESRDDGDLDGDGRSDAVLVLKMADPRNVLANDGLGPPEFDSNPRILVVALADAGGGWRIAAQDSALIPRPWSPTEDDYLDGPEAVAITARGTFTVKLHEWSSAGSWSAGNTTFTFRLEGGCFRLIGYDGFSHHRASGEEHATSVNYLSGRMQTIATDGETGAANETWERIVPTRVCLQDIGDGFEYQSPAIVE